MCQRMFRKGECFSRTLIPAVHSLVAHGSPIVLICRVPKVVTTTDDEAIKREPSVP